MPQNPLALGADLVLHSATKYIGGHSDVVAGLVATSDSEFYEEVKFHQNAQGAVPGPWDCWLLLRGIKTLPVRMREHERNAMELAGWLMFRPDIDKVFYPGLKKHPGHALAKKQMRGFGGIVSIRLGGGTGQAGDFLRRLKIFTLGESLGGVESLACHPASMTHASIPRAMREQNGVSGDLVRLSVGLENIEDLKADISAALNEEL
jgi:cystathionine beta-lyase/cystathionine gamma-synthase